MWNNHKNIKIPFQDTFSDIKIEKFLETMQQRSITALMFPIFKKIMRVLKEESYNNPFHNIFF